jgi:hypothetical protein
MVTAGASNALRDNGKGLSPMSLLTPPSLPVERNRLARIRRQAKKRGLRVLTDWTGNYNLVATHVEPPRALAGLEHASLESIETAVTTPLPPPRPPRQRLRVERLTTPPQASHPAAESFTTLVDLLNGGGA